MSGISRYSSGHASGRGRLHEVAQFRSLDGGRPTTTVSSRVEDMASELGCRRRSYTTALEHGGCLANRVQRDIPMQSRSIKEGVTRAVWEVDHKSWRSSTVPRHGCERLHWAFEGLTPSSEVVEVFLGQFGGACHGRARLAALSLALAVRSPTGLLSCASYP